MLTWTRLFVWLGSYKQTDLEIALTYHNLPDNPSYLPRKHRQQLCLTCHFLSSSAAASHMTRCMEPYSYNCLKILKLFNHEVNKQQITLFFLLVVRDTWIASYLYGPIQCNVYTHFYWIHSSRQGVFFFFFLFFFFFFFAVVVLHKDICSAAHYKRLGEVLLIIPSTYVLWRNKKIFPLTSSYLEL